MPRRKKVIDEKHVMSLKVVGLKKLCTKYKLTVKGKKAVLQDRILEHLQLGKYAVPSEPSKSSELEKIELTIESKERKENVQKSKEFREMMMIGAEKKISLTETTVPTTMSDDLHEQELKQQVPSASNAENDHISKCEEDSANDVMKEKLPTKEDCQLSEQKLSPGEEISNPDGDKGDISEELALPNKAQMNIERPHEKSVTLKSVVEQSETENITAGGKRKCSEAIISVANISNKKPKICNAVEPDSDFTNEIGADGSEAVEDQTQTEFQLHTAVNDETEIQAEAEVQSEAVVHTKAEVQGAVAQDELEADYEAQLLAQENMKSTLMEKQIEMGDDQHMKQDQEEKKSTAQSVLLKVQHHEEKSTQPSKPTKRKNEGRKIKSQENYQRRDHGKPHQGRRDQDRRSNRNQGNWNRNRNLNGGYQQGYQQRQRWLFRQDNWSSNSQHMMNSMPVSQQRRNWNPADGWQQQRSIYHGGYGSYTGRSGGGRGWGRGRGGWQDRRNGRWKNDRSGRR